MASGLIICGIDEAGRGAVIGPLVVAGLAIREGESQALESMGVKDSKKLSKRRREEIYQGLLSNRIPHAVELISPSTVDRYTRRRKGPGLNSLELESVLKIAKKLSPDKIILDSPTRDTAGLQKILREKLDGVDVLCQCHADEEFTVVAAASIIAKVTRDRALLELAQSLGDVGSGYPSDPKTIEYLRKVIKSGKLHGEIRTAWRTIDRLMPVLTDYFRDDRAVP